MDTNLPDPQALETLQSQLAARVRIFEDNDPSGYTPNQNHLVCAMDIQYDGHMAHVAADLSYWSTPKHLGTFVGLVPASFPYVPGYFCFREGPPLLALIHRMRDEGMPQPDVLVIDGHGIAHPRLFGVASWMGLATGLVSVGCAKETLVRFPAKPARTRGAWSPVQKDQRLIGAVLTTQDNVKPVFVSPGHRIGQQATRDLVLGLGGEYRVPDPIRRADFAARARQRGEDPGKVWTDLGPLREVKPPWDE